MLRFGAHVAQDRKTRKQLSARSIVASTLLGIEPPELPAQLLVRSGELFGVAEGATRVAISRMVAARELVAEGGRYRLAGHLLERQARQAASRAGAPRGWDRTWELALVRDGRRDAASRASLRDALRALRLAELREGVWLRPANLAPDRVPDAMAVVDAQCVRWRDARPHDTALAASTLWDLEGWARDADELRAEIALLLPSIERGEVDDVGPGFMASAAVLRHLQHDPLLPAELLPASWPGAALRADYERYDAAFKNAWAAWFRENR
jgi:phenylacetic acid degradation operon negative regulatory protein